MHKKIILGVVICLVLCGASFWAGSVDAGKRAEAADTRLGEIKVKLDESIELVGSLREANSELVRINTALESENSRLENIIGELQEINERLKDLIGGISVSNSDIRQGITEAQTGIGSTIERLRSYLPENKTPESDNNS